MRLTPAQGAMIILTGNSFPRSPSGTLEERIISGYEFLSKIAEKDFGADLIKWHLYLSETNEGGYCYENRHEEIIKNINVALNDTEWLSAVAKLKDNGYFET
jgi:hypothetical protein